MNALADKIYRTMRKTGVLDLIPDEPYLKLMYRLKMGKRLDLKNPKTFNEKLQWLKLNNRQPEYTVMVDKYAVREYIKQVLGESYLIPLLGVWDDPDEIDFSSLPDRFVMKCNHNSGTGMIICKDKSQLDLLSVTETLRKGLRENYFYTMREWPYKEVPRKIICEEFLEDSTAGELIDYKVHCFNGKPEFILVCSGRFSKDGLHEDFYSVNWEKLNVKRPSRPTNYFIQKPEQLEEMLALATKLASGHPFMRTDFYIVDGKIYFGEITLYPAAGMEPFEPKEWDKQFGELLTL